MQTPDRDQLRTEIQNNIREAIKNATQVQVVPRQDAIALLRAEIEGVRAEITSLTQQLTPGLSNAREEAVTDQIDRATDRLESLENQLSAAMTGRSVSTRPPPPPPGNDDIPPGVQTMGIWFFCTAAVTIISLAFLRPWARWLDRRGHAAPAGPDVSPRLDRIEQAIEAVAIEVERISEGQRYTNKMMHEGRALPAPGLGDRWPAATEREPVPVRREGEG